MEKGSDAAYGRGLASRHARWRRGGAGELCGVASGGGATHHRPAPARHGVAPPLAAQYEARCIGMMTWVLSLLPTGRITPALAEFCISSATCGVFSAPSTSLR